MSSTSHANSAAVRSIAVARAVVHRAATGKTEVYYSYERPRWWQLGKWWRLWMHLRFMRAEDRKVL